MPQCLSSTGEQSAHVKLSLSVDELKNNYPLSRPPYSALLRCKFASQTLRRHADAPSLLSASGHFPILWGITPQRRAFK